MTAEQFALLLDRLANGIRPSFKATQRVGLDKVATLCRRCGDIGVSELAARLENPSPVGIDSLARRIRAAHSNGGEPTAFIFLDIDALNANDLKNLVKTLGQKPGSKEKNVKFLKAVVAREASLPPGLDEQIDDALATYSDIKQALRNLSIDELRARFRPLRELSLPVLKGVLGRLGYPTSGNTPNKLVERLLQPLEEIKVSQKHTDWILNEA